MVNQAARNKKKKAKKQAAARESATTEAEQDAYLAAAHAQAQLERERLALEHQRRQALVEAAAAAEFQQHGGGGGRQLQHGSYHVAPDGTVYDEHGELMEDEDDDEDEDDEDDLDYDDEDEDGYPEPEDDDDDDEDDDDEDDDDDDLLDEELSIEVDHQVLQEHQRYIRQQQQQQQQSRSRQQSSNNANNHAAATHEALLGTANDLYKQIENAAAAALSGAHAAGQQQQQRTGTTTGSATFSTSLFPPPNNSASGGNGGGAGEEDDAYWLSLPSHLRSFIRSALPLAAGLSTSPQPQQQGGGGGAAQGAGATAAQQINLTPDQMAAAAAQLAQVVQNGWASTLAKEPLDSPLRSALLNAQQQQANAQGQRGSGNSTTTTIPLGAFALPLHPHPDSPEAAAAFQAAAQAAAQAAVGGGGNIGSNGNQQSQQSSTLPFPSLANLQASLLQLAKMPPGDLHAGFPGNPFAAAAAAVGTPTSPPPNPMMQQQQQGTGESKSSKKKKKKAASAAAAAAAAAAIPPPPPPQQQQPPAPVQTMHQPIPERQYAPLRASKINPNANKAPSPVNVKAPSPVNTKAPSPVNVKSPPVEQARVATPNNGKGPASQAAPQAPPPSSNNNGKSVANGKRPAVIPAARPDSGKGRQLPVQNNNAAPATSPNNSQQQQQQQQYQQQPQQTGIRPTPSAVANGKRPLVATRSAVPVVPSAPAKSVTGNTINNPPAPPPIAQPPHDREPSSKKKASNRDNVPTPTTASTAYGGGPTASSSSTSSGERAKIRDFWLGLSERDRRDLVKVEKDAVLKKMKEQQRHGCTCAVCVRKRQAIEVELEVLYDAYYDELESYAHHQKAYENSKGMDPKIPPPLGPGPFPGSVDIEKMVSSPAAAAPPPASSKNNTSTAKKNSNTNTANSSPVKGKTQPPQPASQAAPPTAATTNKTTNSTGTTQSKDKHSHSPSCPHYPHTHDHKHHHHHSAPNSKDRGKATQNAPLPPASAARKHHHHHHHHRDDEEDYVSDEDEYDDEDDDGEYDDEDDYDDPDDVPETDEEDMPPLEGMDSADEAPPHPPAANPPGRRGAHPPAAQTRRNAAPPPKSAQPPAPVAKKGAAAPSAGSDFFGFGSSLTVKGILTVAEDLLKNDGQKFLEMMESLADKRIQRERAAADGFSESEYEDDEEEEEYDEEEEEDEEDEDELDEEDVEGAEEPLTEEQKMEEGRRMFQVFAARMFEQRVLTAYREKIAQERQMQLLRELEEEDRQAAEREAKKAKDAQKKKDKKKLAKQQKDQERLQAESERLAAEAAAKAEAEAKAEEDRRRAEELRVKREAERKAKEAEALRKEELKKARQLEEARKKEEKDKRAREAKAQREKEEAERKAQKEKDEAERRARREEQERKERLAREAREKEAAAKKAQADKEKAEKEKVEREKQEKEAAAKAASLAAARASPVTIRQVPGQPTRSVSGKVIPGLTKPPAPPTPSPAPTHAAFGKDQAHPSQNAMSPGSNGPTHGLPTLQTPQQKPGQPTSQRSFSNSFVSGLSATSPMAAGRPTFGNPSFGQHAPAGFSSAAPHAYPQTSFGTIDAVSPNQSQRPGVGPPGIGAAGRVVSPMQQQQQQQSSGFGGPPGMQMANSVSPMAAQRSPFASFSSAGTQPGMHTGPTSPFTSARNHPNGMASSLSPGPNTAPLSSLSGGTQPMPIGRGQAPVIRAGSGSVNNSSFQHSASGLAALNMDSQVVQRPGFAPSSQQNASSMPHAAAPSAAPGHARKASQSGVNPIGRPGSKFGSEAGSFGGMGMSDFLSSTDEDPAGTSASSLRSISPPPAVFGSGALLDDMMEEEGLDLGSEMASPSLGSRPGISQSSSSAFFGNSVFGPPVLGGQPSKAADDVWASTPASSSLDGPGKGAGWNNGSHPSMMSQQGFGGQHPFQPPAPPVVPDRGSVIRDRAKIAFTQLNSAYSSQPAGRQSNYPIGDVYRVFLALYPDSASVDVREFLESCLVPGTMINGNGTFSFQQQGQILLMNYEGSKADDDFSPFASAQSQPIGAR